MLYHKMSSIALLSDPVCLLKQYNASSIFTHNTSFHIWLVNLHVWGNVNIQYSVCEHELAWHSSACMRVYLKRKHPDVAISPTAITCKLFTTRNIVVKNVN